MGDWVADRSPGVENTDTLAIENKIETTERLQALLSELDPATALHSLLIEVGATAL